MSTIDHILRLKNRPVVTIDPHETMVAAAKLLYQNRIGLLMVVDNKGKFIVVLSERDIVKAIANQADLIHGMKVETVVTTKVVACRPQTQVDEVMRTMQTRGFRHMPVIHEGRVVGIISVGDCLKFMVQAAQGDAVKLQQLHDSGALTAG